MRSSWRWGCEETFAEPETREDPVSFDPEAFDVQAHDAAVRKVR